MSLSSSIINGNIYQVESLLRSGVPVNIIDEYGFTPLIQTAIVNNEALTKLLLEHGADPTQHDLTGGTALHWAVDNNNKELCQLLLDSGADVNAYTASGEPVGAKAVLRRQFGLKNLLLRYGMNLYFVEDYINAKLLGHRFELRGYVDIVNNKGYFVEIDLEGFFLEFTIDIITRSLYDFQKSFISKYLKPYLPVVQKLLHVLVISRQLIKFEHYQVDVKAYKEQIDTLLTNPILLLPVSYEGHAITLIKCGHLLGKCDRSQNEAFKENVMIYRMAKSNKFDSAFMRKLMYSRQSKTIIDEALPQLFLFQEELEIPLGSQITGNCSWANVEASIPVILLFAFLVSNFKVHNPYPVKWPVFNKPLTRDHLSVEKTIDIDHYCKFAIFFYQQWREWDKDRALTQVLRQFEEASPARKASIAALLAAVLFQRCSADNEKDIARAKKIIPLLKTSGYEYVLESYIEVYCHQYPTQAGKNLQRLLMMID